jgi:hypothetical protein
MALLNLQNHREHPSNPLYFVYFFSKKASADYFEELLIRHNIHFERAVEEGGGERHLFGVKKIDQSRVEPLNYEALGRHREKFIPNAIFRYIILGVTLILLLLAIIGAIKS